MCDCLNLVNAKLKAHNTRLSTGLAINLKTGACCEYPGIMHEKIDKKLRTKQAEAILTFCPFCGVRYVADEERLASDG